MCVVCALEQVIYAIMSRFVDPSLNYIMHIHHSRWRKYELCYMCKVLEPALILTLGNIQSVSDYRLKYSVLPMRRMQVAANLQYTSLSLVQLVQVITVLV